MTKDQIMDTVIDLTKLAIQNSDDGGSVLMHPNQVKNLVEFMCVVKLSLEEMNDGKVPTHITSQYHAHYDNEK